MRTPPGSTRMPRRVPGGQRSPVARNSSAPSAFQTDSAGVRVPKSRVMLGLAGTRRQRYPPPMRFLVLGPLEVAEAGGEPLPIAGSKERTILACLIARAGRGVPVDDLIEELWADHPPRNPEKALVSYVSRLRRALRLGRPSDT